MDERVGTDGAETNGRWRAARTAPAGPPRNLVYVCDGTLSSFAAGERTNAGRVAALLREVGPSSAQVAGYDRGVQGEGLERWLNAATGRTINMSIRAGYGFLASRYRPGDRIYLFGYSRGAYAVRSLAGMIGRVGLLRAEEATERGVRAAFRHYEASPPLPTIETFARTHCHRGVRLEMLGVWDTVKALGLPYPLVSRIAPVASEFHDHALGDHIRHGYHALALDEDRTAYAPIMWERSADWRGRLEQVWFPGNHADVGGEVRHAPDARGLANIALNWMLARAERHGVVLPQDWRERYPEDPHAPSGAERRWFAPGFLIRAPRRTGGADGEAIHMSVRARMAARPGYAPKAAPPIGAEPA